MTKKRDDFPCKDCGANLKFQAGTNALTCEYCGSVNTIEDSTEEIKELDYKAFIANKLKNEELEEIITVKCTSCAAEVTFKPNVTADNCAFCGTSIVVTNKLSKKSLKPRSLLPFKITEKEAKEKFSSWLSSLWFAPNTLTAYAKSENSLKGVYMPFWTYDSNTYSSYRGQRGDDYRTTEYFTNEKGERESREVTKTRWHNVNGNVNVPFDDVLVVASHSLPKEYAQNLEPWDLTNLVPYKDDYLSGFRTESYQVDVENGFEVAKKIMYHDICGAIEDQIGGDHQKIDNVNTNYSEITFKHILLPVWISSYRYQEKIFRFMINARTGEVQGERPWSIIKITLAVLLALIILGIIIYFSRK